MPQVAAALGLDPARRTLVNPCNCVR